MLGQWPLLGVATFAPFSHRYTHRLGVLANKLHIGITSPDIWPASGIVPSAKGASEATAGALPSRIEASAFRRKPGSSGGLKLCRPCIGNPSSMLNMASPAGLPARGYLAK